MQFAAITKLQFKQQIVTTLYVVNGKITSRSDNLLVESSRYTKIKRKEKQINSRLRVLLSEDFYEKNLSQQKFVRLTIERALIFSTLLR